MRSEGERKEGRRGEESCGRGEEGRKGEEGREIREERRQRGKEKMNGSG